MGRADQSSKAWQKLGPLHHSNVQTFCSGSGGSAVPQGAPEALLSMCLAQGKLWTGLCLSARMRKGLFWWGSLQRVLALRGDKEGMQWQLALLGHSCVDLCVVWGFLERSLTWDKPLQGPQHQDPCGGVAATESMWWGMLGGPSVRFMQGWLRLPE